MGYFRVLVDGAEVYNPLDRSKLLINPVVKTSLDEAGSFDFTMDTLHSGYSSIIPYGSDVDVLEDGVSIFSGRALPPSINSFRQKSYHCEGALAYLNDVIIPPLSQYVLNLTDGSGEGGLTDGSEEGNLVQRVMYMSEYLDYVMGKYDTFQTKQSRKFYIGEMDLEVDPAMPYNSDFKTAMDVIRSEILPYTGGYLYAYKDQTNGLTLEIRQSFAEAGQPIQAGVNLLDFSEAQQTFYTAVMAKGGKAKSDWESEEAPVQTDTPIAMDHTIIDRYGLICAYKYWPDCVSASDLTSRCNTFLATQQFGTMSLDVTAMDLHITNRQYDLLRLGRIVRFISPIPGEAPVDLMVTGMEVHLDTGEKRVQLGDRNRNRATQLWGGGGTAVTNNSTNNTNVKVDQSIRQGSVNPVSSGAVYNALQNSGDKWIHQIDGVAQETGTVNFVNFSG